MYMGRYFRIILVAVFLLSVLLIVVLQFNSDRNIDQLISGNETLMEELRVRNDLVMLQSAITSLESKVRGEVISGQWKDTAAIEKEFQAIDAYRHKLVVLEKDNHIVQMLGDLYRQVDGKVTFNRQVIRVFQEQGKQAAEAVISTGAGAKLTDSIRTTTARIHAEHEQMVTALINETDKNGLKAKTLGAVMAIIAAIASILAFGFASYKMRQQEQLIQKLNASERAAKEAVHVKENFLANMSHEIRTPMNAILGFTDLLKQEPLDKKAGEFVQTIHQSGENLLNIINDILDLSRIEAGMMKIESAPFRISTVTDAVEQMLRKKAIDKGLQLSFRRDPSLPDVIIGDATRLTQILVNLVGNAIKFTDKGQVTVSLNAKQNTGETFTLVILVEDTGVGIASSKLDAIFERFTQADDEVNRKFGGTGLGLSIVKDLVELLKGSISVESVEGKGTRFHVMLPYVISAEQLAAEGETDQLPGVKPLHLRVLVAEDNSINQNLVRHLLSQWGISYDMVDNGMEVLAALAKQPYDLILMDIQMPGMDGYEATRKIRQELTLGIPIVAMTAHALAGEKENCLAQGMNNYIAKPLRQAELYAILQAYSMNENPSYHTIDLAYMRDVSGGDKAYERLVTSQFIEAVPEELDALLKAWDSGDQARAKQIAHNLKTTVSVMGIDEKLKPMLDSIEYDQLTTQGFREQFKKLQVICADAVREAHRFRSQLVD